MIEQLYHSIMKTVFYSILLRKSLKSITYFLVFASMHLNAQTYQWAHGFNTPVTNGGRSNKIKIDGSLSDVYNVGTFSTNGTTGVDFDPSTGTNTLVTQASTYNGFVSKYTSSGTAVLALVFKGGTNEVMDIAIDGSDNMYVTGFYRGVVDFDPAAATSFTLPNSATDRIFIAKINANGTLNWCKSIGGSGDARGLSIAFDGSSNVFVGGYFENTTDFDPSPTSTITLVGAGRDGFLLKLSATTGNYGSAVKIGDIGLDEVTNIKLDNNGDLFACGYYSSSTAFSGATYAGGIDGYIGKFLPTNLTTTWIKGFGGTEDDTPKEIAQDGTGSMYCTGYFKGTADFDPSAAVTSFTTPSITDIDGFVLKFNSSTGNLTWARQITGTGTQAPQGIGLDNIGYSHIAGFFQGVTDFNPGPAQVLQSNNGTSEDIFKLTLTGGGAYFASQVIGDSNNDRCYGIAVEPSTGFYLLTGTLNDAAAVDFNTSSATNNITGDWYIARYNGCINPGAPVSASSPTVCQGASATFTTAVGSFTTNWYSSVSSTTTITTGSSLTTPTLSSNYIVYVANTNTCGTSGRVPLTAYVDNNFLNTVLSSTSVCQGETVVVTASGAQTYNFGSGSTASNTFTTPVYNTTGTWSSNYSGTNTNGCTQTTSYSVLVKATPSIAFGSGTYSGVFCDNTVNTATMTATGTASTYTWMPGNVTGTTAVLNFPSAPGTYSVTLSGTGTNGCIKSITNSSFAVYPSPIITVNSGAICSGKTFTIAPGGASTYTYSSGSNTVSPSSTTSYSVMGTNSSGCISTNAAVATVSINPTPTITVNNGAICSGGSFTITPSGASTYTISGGSYTVSPSSTTSYSITGTSSQGCASSNTAISTVSVQSSLTVSIAGSNSVCNGSSVSLTANGAATYTWSTGATSYTIAPSPTSNTTYTVIGASGTCSNTAVKSITVNPTPTVTANTSNTLLCTGNSATLTASGASTYDWLPGSLSGSSVSVNPTSNTTYTVTGTNTFGCSDISIITQSVSLCTGVENQASNFPSINFYPNPFNDLIIVESETSLAKIIITDVLGKQVLTTENNNETQIQIDTHLLPEGIYFISIQINNQIKTYKIIKK